MANLNQQTEKILNTIPEEHILVVKRTELFDKDEWQGIRSTDIESYVQRIKKHHCFLPRTLMELDPTYKQIIPYVIFNFEDKYFLMQRRSNASEQRLRNKMSLGIGGHMRIEDMEEGDIVSWAMREFHEEVTYSGTFTVSIIGMLNDDSNPVGQVHMGIVMLLKGTSGDISIKSEHKSGSLVTIQECEDHFASLESWSQMVLESLKLRST